jgi:DNA processing protein
MQKHDIVTISKTDKSFPAKLNNLHKVPEKLYVKGGDIAKLTDSPSVGIVGSRKISPYGKSVTHSFASYLAGRRITIVSGLAFGVDSLAHESALAAGGKAIAVLPSSVEEIYPPSHFRLANKIIDSGGALLSEYAKDKETYASNFIERNRIIAALSDVLLITEAAAKSGSLHTARFALELGKTVLAVPGSIYSPTSAGCNNLIKMGAVLAGSEEDVLDALGFSRRQLDLSDVYYPENGSEKSIIKLLKGGISDGSELLSRAKLETSQFQQTVTMLEIKGVITPLGNNHWRLR